MRQIILGINAYHGDSSACLVIDGRLIAAAEEERFCRTKHWAGFPIQAIRYCLAEGNVRLSDVQHVAVNRDPKANLWRKIAFAILKRPELRFVKERLKNAQEWASIRKELVAHFPDEVFSGEVHHIEHHLTHLASAFYVSPFPKAVVVSVDGFGDFASAAWGLGEGHRIRVDGRVFFPHSLGIFYESLTQFLGFPYYGDEYKVMGLAPYGKPIYLEQMRKIVRLQEDGRYELDLAYFRHHKERIEYKWKNCSPFVGTLFTPRLEELLGPTRGKGEELTQRHRDIASSVQAMYEEAFFHLLTKLHARYQCDTLTLAGGCGMNSVANGKVYLRTPFKKLYVQSAAGDAGGALGAAYEVWHTILNRSERFLMHHSYWGPHFETAAIGSILSANSSALEAQGCKVQEFKDEAGLCSETATAIAQGKVIGWFQGRMEWGPRALGNRSILCDPRNGNMKDVLNQKIKRRESFRPFAPSILRSAVPNWFEIDDDVPFMMEVFQIQKEKRALIPDVTHVDGSGRLQTVTEESNSRYFKLIQSFEKITGVPLLLNTSFNENEPIVCSPEQALDCFLRTKMDVLVLDNFVISRN
jgi:carbamoyltransferase